MLARPKVCSAQHDRSVDERLSQLERAVSDLSARVSELSALLKRALPPSPIEEVEAYDLPIGSAAVKGAASARIALVEFSDFQCPFCGRHAQGAYVDLQRLYVSTGKLRYVFRNLPIGSIHPFAVQAAEAAECSGEQ